MEDFEKFINLHNQKKEKIAKLADAIQNLSSIEPKFAEKELPDGSTQKIGKVINSTGLPVYTVSKDDKNIMTFTSKNQLFDYLGD